MPYFVAGGGGVNQSAAYNFSNASGTFAGVQTGTVTGTIAGVGLTQAGATNLTSASGTFSGRIISTNLPVMIANQSGSVTTITTGTYSPTQDITIYGRAVNFSTSGVTIRLGFDQFSTNANIMGADTGRNGIELIDGNAVWRVAPYNNGTSPGALTTATIDNAAHQYRILWIGSGSTGTMQFYYDGTLNTTTTTNIPSSGTALYKHISTSGGATSVDMVMMNT